MVTEILFYLFIYLVIFLQSTCPKACCLFFGKIGCVAKKRFKWVQVSSVHSGSANSLGNEAVEPRLLGGDHG